MNRLSIEPYRFYRFKIIERLIFRVFVSSTFTDMKTERRILQEKVFPKLKAFCSSRGASFQDVDLRWGVNEESQLNQATMDICFSEIARCQKLSTKPNFIILLGDKYGWQPIPSRIPSNEMEQIFGTLTNDKKKILNRWYQEDLNAVPPEFVLQPRDENYSEYDHWYPEERRIQGILRQAVDRLFFSEAQNSKYFLSATHQEILAGALNTAHRVIDPKEHVFAYIRTINNLPENEKAKAYIDISGNSRDEYSRKQLKRLKQELSTTFPQDHLYQYGANWNGDCVLDEPEDFANRVFADLSAIIEEQLAEIEDVDELTSEIYRHKTFQKQH